LKGTTVPENHKDPISSKEELANIILAAHHSSRIEVQNLLERLDRTDTRNWHDPQGSYAHTFEIE
jgi:hypothetical protein